MFQFKVFRTVSLTRPELGHEAYPAVSLLGEKVLFSVPPNAAGSGGVHPDLQCPPAIALPAPSPRAGSAPARRHAGSWCPVGAEGDGAHTDAIQVALISSGHLLLDEQRGFGFLPAEALVPLVLSVPGSPGTRAQVRDPPALRSPHSAHVLDLEGQAGTSVRHGGAEQEWDSWRGCR